MRIAILIVVMVALTVSLVQIRRAEIRTYHHLRQLEARQAVLARRLGNQQVHLAGLTQQQALWQRAQKMGLGLIDTTAVRRNLAARPPAPGGNSW
ncbi:MAG: hypothetical protein LLG01_01445 [Planctomycetaceae bacterium]|nr:hypothetical protein [Planctomycetaceae bacterium]